LTCHHFDIRLDAKFWLVDSLGKLVHVLQMRLDFSLVNDVEDGRTDHGVDGHHDDCDVIEPSKST
jgi:hypothetical protein